MLRTRWIAQFFANSSDFVTDSATLSKLPYFTHGKFQFNNRIPNGNVLFVASDSRLDFSNDTFVNVSENYFRFSNNVISDTRWNQFEFTQVQVLLFVLSFDTLRLHFIVFLGKPTFTIYTYYWRKYYGKYLVILNKYDSRFPIDWVNFKYQGGNIWPKKPDIFSRGRK